MPFEIGRFKGNSWAFYNKFSLFLDFGYIHRSIERDRYICPGRSICLSSSIQEVTCAP